MPRYLGLWDVTMRELTHKGYARQPYIVGTVTEFGPAKEDWGYVCYIAIYDNPTIAVAREYVDVQQDLFSRFVGNLDCVAVRLFVSPTGNESDDADATDTTDEVEPTYSVDDPDVDTDGFDWRTGRYRR